MKRYGGSVSTPHRRTTVYLDPGIHRALRRKAVETDRSFSDLVNDAIKLSLAEDAEDRAAFHATRAVATIQQDSVRKGTDRIPMADIDAEVRKARAARRKRRA